MISPKEIMRHSILCYEGKAQIVQSVGEYIMFEGRREWIGGSLINGEPISEAWLDKLGFNKNGDVWALQPELENIEYRIKEFNGWIFSIGFGDSWNQELRVLTYVHQLQGLFFYLTERNIKIPKLK